MGPPSEDRYNRQNCVASRPADHCPDRSLPPQAASCIVQVSIQLSSSKFLTQRRTVDPVTSMQSGQSFPVRSSGSGHSRVLISWWMCQGRKGLAIGELARGIEKLLEAHSEESRKVGVNMWWGLSRMSGSYSQSRSSSGVERSCT